MHTLRVHGPLRPQLLAAAFECVMCESHLNLGRESSGPRQPCRNQHCGARQLKDLLSCVRKLRCSRASRLSRLEFVPLSRNCCVCKEPAHHPSTPALDRRSERPVMATVTPPCASCAQASIRYLRALPLPSLQVAPSLPRQERAHDLTYAQTRGFSSCSCTLCAKPVIASGPAAIRSL